METGSETCTSYSPLDPREDTESRCGFEAEHERGTVTAHSIRERILKAAEGLTGTSAGQRVTAHSIRERILKVPKSAVGSTQTCIVTAHSIRERILKVAPCSAARRLASAVTAHSIRERILKDRLWDSYRRARGLLQPTRSERGY